MQILSVIEAYSPNKYSFSWEFRKGMMFCGIQHREFRFWVLLGAMTEGCLFYFILFLFFSTQVAWVVMVNAGDIRDMGQEDPLEKSRKSTPAFLPGESHGQRSLVGNSPWVPRELDTTEQLHFHFHFPFKKFHGWAKSSELFLGHKSAFSPGSQLPN